MKPKSLAQLMLFFIITAFWLKIAWPLMTKEAAFFGAIGGLTLHWLLTNKGNKNVVYIKPFTAGWRVLIYDILLMTWLLTLWQQAGGFSAFLEVLMDLNEKMAVLASLVGAIIVDYSVGG